MNDLELAKIERRIYSIRGVRVILDADLAVLYGVSTKRLNEQFRRNRRRFPDDFAFQLTAEETADLRSQFATSSAASTRSKVAKCDLKDWSRTAPKIPTPCIHRARRAASREHPQQCKCRPHERVCHSRFCKNARAHGDQRCDSETPRRDRQVVTRARFRASRHLPETPAALVTDARSAPAEDRLSSLEQITDNR